MYIQYRPLPANNEEYLNKLENAKREPKARMIIRPGRGLAFLPAIC